MLSISISKAVSKHLKDCYTGYFHSMTTIAGLERGVHMTIRQQTIES